jgi:hypothetical protein
VPPRDNLATLIAIGLLAYASADIAHHVVGHGGACLALGGRIASLSSIFVDCTVRGATVDLAGPFANLLLGSAALAAAYRIPQHAGAAAKLFVSLVAGFNLFWFFLQLVFSAATRTDDWAWAMHQFHVGAPVRYGLIVLGAIGYLAAIRVVASPLAGFARPQGRIWRLVLTAWLTGGIFACTTAVFDPAAAAAILHHAAPQSFGLAIGLLFVPVRAARRPAPTAPAIGFSLPWLLAAAAIAAFSILALGPGFAI